MTDHIIDLLNRLADLKDQEEVIRLQFQGLRDQVLTPEIKAQLEEIDLEEETTIEAVSSGVYKLTDEIKTAVIAGGASVKGAYLHAVYSKPRITWDSKGLEGFAVAHPEIEAFKKVGNPSVSIRSI